MALFLLSLCPFDISVVVGAFVTGLSQISSFLSYRCWSCTELCEAFTFLMENIYMFVQIDGMVYQQKGGIGTSYGH